ncbi:MAG: ATP-binding cassette domain-containing protein [Bacteroidales bacterium]|nr:ATP-binding cassette domain-containing protein [Bacteroidales bacterium]MCF8333236.1 ATP-binding cassette domain-containing protein [Bacteroidales bacterium]
MDLDVIIDLNNLSVYQNEFLVLQDVNLTVRKGEFVYLIGKTGTGKSSLLMTIYGELPVYHGSALVSGYDLTKLRKKQIPYLRRSIGVVFQDFNLLTDRSVNKNLGFVLRATGWKNKEAMDARINNVLEKVGLTTKGHKMPHQLAGGEQQRVVIARALLNDPDVILADEPTGNLDPETSEGIMELLFEISKTGRAILMATHDYSLFHHFPAKTVKCEDGTVKHSEHQVQ